MIRPGTVLWALCVVLVSYALFQMKYEVMRQENQFAALDKQIADSREAVRVLNAEWSYLTQPSRLDELRKRYLTLVPIGTAQLGSIAAIPMRDGAAPQPVPAPASPAVLPPATAGAAPPKAQLATFKPRAER
jgi:hypothetical protein